MVLDHKNGWLEIEEKEFSIHFVGGVLCCDHHSEELGQTNKEDTRVLYEAMKEYYENI